MAFYTIVPLALALWRIAVDLGWPFPFPFPAGFLSHWQVWLAIAALFGSISMVDHNLGEISDEELRDRIELLRRRAELVREANLARRAERASQKKKIQGTPPPSAEYLLYLVLPRRDRETITRDLEEQYSEVVTKFGVPRARFFYWTRAIANIAWCCGDRVLRPTVRILRWGFVAEILRELGVVSKIAKIIRPN